MGKLIARQQGQFLPLYKIDCIILGEEENTFAFIAMRYLALLACKVCISTYSP